MSSQQAITAVSRLERSELPNEAQKIVAFFNKLGGWPTNKDDLLTIYYALNS